jgi:hypothetical protein
MAVDGDTLYDVLQEGKLIGTFTVGPVTNVSGIWVAEGKIKESKTEMPAAEVSLGNKTAPKPAADDEDKPPVLRRPDSKPANTPPGNTPSNTPPHADNPPAQPKPAEAKAPASVDDPGRPTLKRGTPESKPEPESTKQSSATAPKPSTKEQSLQVKETYTAISDANANEYHPYEYAMTPQDRERFTRDVTGMALEALTRFSSTHSTAGVPVPGPLHDPKLTAYDLDFNNMATIVLTADKPATPRAAKGTTEPQPNLQLFVTVVARTDIYGNIRRLFTHVTDASHLDTIPRLELIDAVDAEGTGRGELLFRQIGDMGSRSFILYRVGPDQLDPLFEGASHH